LNGAQRHRIHQKPVLHTNKKRNTRRKEVKKMRNYYEQKILPVMLEHQLIMEEEKEAMAEYLRGFGGTEDA